MEKYKLLFVLFYTAFAFGQNFTLDKGWWHNFEGTLAGKKIGMSIYLSDNDSLNGNYYYEPFETKIMLKGKITGDKIELTEYSSGKPNGFFSGRIFTDTRDRCHGKWTNASKQKSFDFNLEQVEATQSESAKRHYADFHATDNEIEAFAKQIKSAISKGNKVWISNHAFYPSTTFLEGKKKITLKNKNQLLANYDAIFHKAYRDKMKTYRTVNLFNNYQGVMLGDGNIWINEKQFPNQKKPGLFIIAINN